MTDTKDIESNPGFVAFREHRKAFCGGGAHSSAEEWAISSRGYRADWRAIALAAHQAHERQAWRPPDEHPGQAWVLVYDGEREFIGSCTRAGDWFERGLLVTCVAWRPLPAPPTEGGA